MKAVFSIVDYSLYPRLETIYKKEGLKFRMVTHGFGSADSRIMDLLGFGENKKCVMVGVTYRENVLQLYRRMDNELKISRAGRGIAFTVHVNSISAVISKLYGCDLQTGTCSMMKEGEHPMTEPQTNYELIISVVQRGGFQAVKEAAKSAGARGGTVIHGLGLGGEEAAKFLGISIQPEKDVILIVVNSEDKNEIMSRIAQVAGIRTENRGICFSLPVDSAYGLAEKEIPFLDEEPEEE